MIKEGYFVCVFNHYYFLETPNKHKSKAMAQFIGYRIGKTSESEIQIINELLYKVDLEMYQSNGVNRVRIYGRKINMDIPQNELTYVGKYEWR